MLKEGQTKIRSNVKELKEMHGGHIKSMRKGIKKAEKARHA